MNDMNMTPAPKSRVYALADAQGRVTRIEGEYSLPADLTGWVKIDEGYGDAFALAQSHYLPQPLYTEDGVLRYKLELGQVVERTADELAADRAARPEPAPSQLDRLVTIKGFGKSKCDKYGDEILEVIRKTKSQGSNE